MLGDITHKQLIKNGLHFESSSGIYDGKKVFIKTAITRDQNQRIQKEAAGLQAMFELDPTSLYYQTPEILYTSSNTIITSWVEGTLMVDHLVPATVEVMWAKLRELYHYIDSRTTSGKGITRMNQPRKRNNIDFVMQQLVSLNYDKFIDTTIVESIADYIHTNMDSVETRFTHGDLQPSNILITPTEQLAIIDCESCSWLWPRHYNIVNFTYNYLLKDLPDIAVTLIANLYKYFNEADIDISEHIRQINFSAAVRSIQILLESLATNSKSGTPDIPEKTSTNVAYIMQAILKDQLFTKPLEV